MITKFQALYDKDYTKPQLFTGEPVRASLVEVLPGKIDGQWRHSWHWPDPQDDWDWYISRVKESISRERMIANQRLEDLIWAEKMVNQLELEDND